MQANLARSETQVIRYKSTAEAAEKAEAELKIERRKLQREVRKLLLIFFVYEFKNKNFFYDYFITANDYRFMGRMSLSIVN